MNTLRQLTAEFIGTLRTALHESTPLRWALCWQCALLAISMAALPFDTRHILGLNPWIKPMKFELSVIAYLLTLTLFLRALATDSRQTAPAAILPLTTHVTAQRGAWHRSRLWLGWGFALAVTAENTIIALQSARGVRSHMNYSSLADGILFGLMGLFIAFNTVLVAWLLALWCLARPGIAVAARWGVALGLTMLLLGSVEGVFMVQHGAHTVGAQDGLAGLPFVNWSRSSGDLRVAHFFAIHALQIFPLAGFLLARTSWKSGLQVAAVCLFAGVYTCGVWWLFAEAMLGHPLLAY